MTPDNFCYWLQGYFELSDADVLNAEQVDCAMRHSDLVIAYCQRHELFVPAVITTVRTLLRIMDNTLAPKLTAEIKRVLAETFEHVIDPKAGPADVQEKLNAMHGSGRINYNKPVYRC